MNINTIHFYRNLEDRSVLVTGDKLIRNPFSFNIAYMGDLKTLLTVSQVRNMLRSGISHGDIFDNHRYVPVTPSEPSCEEISSEVKVYVYSSPCAQNGVKVTTEHRPHQTLLFKVEVAEKDKVQEVMKELRERIRRGDLIEQLKEEFGEVVV